MRWTLGVALVLLAAAPSLAQVPTQAPGGRVNAADAGDASAVCTVNPPVRASGSDWLGAGGETDSARFQKTPGLTAADVPKLKLKWSFAMTGGGMPTVVGDRLFMTNRNGRLYALDARTGCIRWARRDAPSRTTPVIARTSASPSGWAVIVGERNRTIRAFDAQTGQHLWRSVELETHRASVLTAAPLVHDGVVFAPVSSSEENLAERSSYPCCSFRGSLAALELATGKLIWKTYTVSEPLHPSRRNAIDVQLQGPAGGAIWSSPTADPKRGLVYVATGDSYTDEPTKGADAIIAIEMKTGEVRWIRQVMENDNFINGCGREPKAANCPSKLGGDFDFGASPILVRAASGREVLLAGQKSGIAYGIDPDRGTMLWTYRVGVGSEMGGVQWGMAADGRRLFVANSDMVNLSHEAQRAQGRPPPGPERAKGRPGLTAFDPATGKVIWHTAAPVAPCRYPRPERRTAGAACNRALSAALSAMPGVVFAGALDGWFRAFDAATGKVIWEYSTTAQTYDTVNGVQDLPGDEINGMGPAIAGGMVYVMSGYVTDDRPNVLLAFSVDGK